MKRCKGHRTRIKICGITTLNDAMMAIELGADAVGINLIPTSKRCVSASTAVELIQGVPLGVDVAVLVAESRDHSLYYWQELLKSFPSHSLQWHGEESTAYLAHWGDYRLTKALSVSLLQNGIAEYIDQCQLVGVRLASVVIDAPPQGEHRGGTGNAWDWNSLELEGLGLPCFIAGGLTAENVAQAISQSRPFGVDVSSGVERSPGRKCPEKLAQFIAEVRRVDSLG